MVSQYLHESWGTERGFVGGSVSSIAQTTDGYLWIGTDKGLVRFDGLNFRRFEQANPGSFVIGPTRTLLADPRENLWILLQNTKLFRYHDGTFELSPGEAENGISAIGKENAGGIFVFSFATDPLTDDDEDISVLDGPVIRVSA